MSECIMEEQTVWKINNPKITGKVVSVVDNIATISIKNELSDIRTSSLTNNPLEVIKLLLINVSLQEETIKELRNNYWNVHQELLKMK